MTLGVLMLSLLVVTAGQAPQDDVRKEADKLQGSWAIAMFNGEEVPAGAEAYLVFTGDKYEQWTGPQMDERGAVKLDVKARPMAIDLIIAEGADAGKTQLGAYQLDGDTLYLSMAMPGDASRPALGQGALNVVLKKSK